LAQANPEFVCREETAAPSGSDISQTRGCLPCRADLRVHQYLSKSSRAARIPGRRPERGVHSASALRTSARGSGMNSAFPVDGGWAALRCIASQLYQARFRSGGRGKEGYRGNSREAPRRLVCSGGREGAAAFGVRVLEHRFGGVAAGWKPLNVRERRRRSIARTPNAGATNESPAQRAGFPPLVFPGILP